MFTIDSASTFTHDVAVMVPIDGGHREDTLKTTFNYLDVDKAKTFDLTTPAGTNDFLSAAVASFHDLQDQDGQALPYSEEVRGRLLKLHYVRQALTVHYFRAISRVKEGN